MKFTVVWLPSAKNWLAEIWLTAPDRGVITIATNQIDQKLKFNADTAGEGRSDGVRILIVSPLSVYFEVSTEDRIATVFDIWQYPHPKN